MVQKSLAAAAAFSALFLAACSSGGGDTDANVTSVNLGADPVFADGTTIDTAKFNGRTFPFYFVEGFDNGASTELRRGRGIAVVSADGNSLTLFVDDSSEIDLARIGASSTFVTDTSPAVVFAVDDLTVLRTVRIDDTSLLGSADLVGGFGFQTPSSLMPDSGTATYSSDSYGKLILSENGNDDVISLESDAAVVLDVNFGRGTVEGTLFNGSGFADIDNDSFADDALVMLVTLEDGSISGGTFDGTVSGDAVAFIDDVEFFDLNPRFINSDVDGVFFGNDAETIAGTYEADYRGNAGDGTIVGYFDVGID